MTSTGGNEFQIAGKAGWRKKWRSESRPLGAEKKELRKTPAASLVAEVDDDILLKI